MTRAGLVLCCCAFMVVAGFSESPAPRRNTAPSALDQQARSVVSADSPEKAASRYRDLFQSATADGQRRLQASAPDSVAIQAAWEEVELTLPEKSERMVRPDAGKLAWFIGFLEGRGRVKAPSWWTEAVLDCRANRCGNVYAGRNLTKSDPKRTPPPRPATLDRLDGKLIVRVGAQSVPIPDDLPGKLQHLADDTAVAALITPRHCYLARPGSIGYPYKLFSVDRVTTTTSWASDVWGSWWWDANGSHVQWVEVTEQGDRVAVFGLATMGFHAEAFRVSDGANLFRFSNSYSSR